MERWPATYILANKRNGTLYIGVTSDLYGRIHEHRSGVKSGFATKYQTYGLVWYEMQPDMPTAIKREKQLKEWRRSWKIELIEKTNPLWEDLTFRAFGESIPFPEPE